MTLVCISFTSRLVSIFHTDDLIIKMFCTEVSDRRTEVLSGKFAMPAGGQAIGIETGPAAAFLSSQEGQ